jgi:hypothetical protein
MYIVLFLYIFLLVGTFLAFSLKMDAHHRYKAKRSLS